MSPVSLVAGQDQIQPIAQGCKEKAIEIPQHSFGYRRILPKMTIEPTTNTTLETSAIPLTDSISIIQIQLNKPIYFIINNTV